MQKAIPIIEKIAEDNKNRTFAYYTGDDIKQAVWEMCLDALRRYNKNRGAIENFLRKHVSNRLKNLKRDRYFNICEDEELSWRRINIVNALPMHSVSEDSNLAAILDTKVEDYSPHDHLVAKELKEYILRRLDEKMISAFLELIEGGKIKKSVLQTLRDNIEEILIDYHARKTP